MDCNKIYLQVHFSRLKSEEDLVGFVDLSKVNDLGVAVIRPLAKKNHKYILLVKRVRERHCVWYERDLNCKISKNFAQIKLQLQRVFSAQTQTRADENASAPANRPDSPGRGPRSPDARPDSGLPLDSAEDRGPQRVLVVSNLQGFETAQQLVNIVGCFAALTRVIFHKHPGNAILQFETHADAFRVFVYLHKRKVFKSKLNVQFSEKYSSISQKSTANKNHEFLLVPGHRPSPSRRLRALPKACFSKHTLIMLTPSHKTVPHSLKDFYAPVRRALQSLTLAQIPLDDREAVYFSA